MSKAERISRRALLTTTASLGSTAFVLAACGQVAQPPATQEKQEAAPQPEAKAPQEREHKPVVALLISQREDTIKKTEATLALFKEDHPEVIVDWRMGYSPEVLPPLLAAGTPPDIGWWGIAPQQIADLVKDVRPILQAHGVDLSAYVQSVVQGMMWQGKMLAIPYGLNTTTMFYNQAHFDKAGLNYPTDDTTWEQVLNDAEAITTQLNQGQETKTIYGISTMSYIPHFMPFVYGGMLDTNGELATDREVALTMLRMLREAWSKREAAPGPNNKAVDLSGFAIKAFVNQQLGQVLFGTWGIVPSREQSELKFDAVEPPYLEVGGKRVRGAFMGQQEHYILETSTNPDAEILAVWYAQPKHQRWQGEEGHAIPVHIPSQESFRPPASDPRPANQLAFVRSAEYAPPFWPHPEYPKLSGALGKHLGPYLNEGSITAEEALDNALTEIEQVLADWKKENA